MFSKNHIFLWGIYNPEYDLKSASRNMVEKLMLHGTSYNKKKKVVTDRFFVGIFLNVLYAAFL